MKSLSKEPIAQIQAFTPCLHERKARFPNGEVCVDCRTLISRKMSVGKL